MGFFSFLFTFLLILNILTDNLSEDYLLHHKNIVKRINSLRTTWKAELYPIDVRSLLGVLLDPETKTFTKGRLSIPARNITPIPDLPENFDLREEYPYCNSLFEIRFKQIADLAGLLLL